MEFSKVCNSNHLQFKLGFPLRRICTDFKNHTESPSLLSGGADIFQLFSLDFLYNSFGMKWRINLMEFIRKKKRRGGRVQLHPFLKKDTLVRIFKSTVLYKTEAELKFIWLLKCYGTAHLFSLSIIISNSFLPLTSPLSHPFSHPLPLSPFPLSFSPFPYTNPTSLVLSPLSLFPIKHHPRDY